MPAARAERPARPLTRAESRDPRQPVYSPDGRLLLLASNRNLGLWTANSDGSWPISSPPRQPPAPEWALESPASHAKDTK
jgi:hypothetical protein